MGAGLVCRSLNEDGYNFTEMLWNSKIDFWKYLNLI